jgi:hypothetical protein
MVLNDKNNIKLKNNKNLLATKKIRLQNKAKNLLLNSLASYCSALIKNSTVLYEINSQALQNIELVNLLLNFILAIRFNNKIYSKYCFTQFVNSYSYVQSKKLLYKVFVLKLKTFNYKKK